MWSLNSIIALRLRKVEDSGGRLQIHNWWNLLRWRATYTPLMKVRKMWYNFISLICIHNIHTHTRTHTTHTHMLQAVTGNLVLRNFTKNITPPIPNNQPHSHVHSKHFVRILTSLPLRAVLDGCKEGSVGGGGKERGAGNVKERNTLACVISFGSSHVASKHRRTHTHARTHNF